MKNRSVIWFVSFLIQVALVQCDWQVSLRFERFVNPGGLGSNGHCCDGRWPACQRNGCDHAFTICLDTPSSSIDECTYVRKESSAINNQDTVDFGDVFGGVNNPIVVTQKGAAPDVVTLKVIVSDMDDLTDSEFVDLLDQDIRVLRPLSWDDPVTRPFTLHTRTTLDVELSFHCVRHWYGENCEVHCAPPSGHQHYVCDEMTGQKLCQQGWTGRNCEINACGALNCQNGGTCFVGQDGNPTCHCTDQYAGTLCDKQQCEIYCFPGECLTSRRTGEYTCLCPDGFAVTKVAERDEGINEERSFRSFNMITICRENPTTTVAPPVRTSPPTTSTPSTTTTPGTTTPPPTTPEPTVPWIDRPDADCDNLALSGYRYQDGVYNIRPGNGPAFPVYCDMGANGWTIIQQRIDDTVSFHRNWDQYKRGFGEAGLSKNFWIGLDNLYRLTNQRKYKLQISMRKADGGWRHAEYGHFYIENEANLYRIHVSDFSGDAGDALQFRDSGMTRFHDGMPFSTYDRDNDHSTATNCAAKYESGWWFNACFWANLNGRYRSQRNGWPPCDHGKCVSWRTIDNYADYSLIRVEMRVFPLEESLQDYKPGGAWGE